LSLGFEHFAVSIEKSHFFQKSEKLKISKFRGERKKQFRKRGINVQKISQIEDGHLSLGRFFKKIALNYERVF
jgi:hypothetical protein